MRKLLSKSIAILLGVVFLASGASVALAGPSASVAAQQPVAAMDPALSATEQRALAAARDNYTAAVAAMQAATTDAARQAAVLQLQTAAAERSRLETAAANQVALANATSNGGRPVLQQDIQGLQTLQGQLQAAIASGDQARINTATAAYQQSLATATAAYQQTTGNAAEDALLKPLSCNPLTLSIKGCIPITVYYLIYKPISYLLMASGYLFDKTLALSIDSSFVNQQFVADSWKIIRDFSNMLFIFVLLYTGIATMLGSKDWPRAVKQVVIVALFINFSLFFTKIVIDAGNILAVGIKSSINTGASFSESLSSGFQPQVFLKAAGTVADPMNATIVFILAAIVSAFAAYVFFKAALLFVGRLLAFWLLMIVSPFAFISTTFPEGKGNIFNKWFGHLTSQAFVAPVFLFFLYLIMQVLTAGGGILSSLGQTSGSGWFDKLIAPTLIGVMIIVALQKSLKFATDMAGDFGELGAKIGGKVMGVGALGGAVVAQKTIGRAALAASKSEGFKAFAAKSKWGRAAYSLNERAATGSFDVRNAPGGAKLGIGAGTKGSFAKTVSEAKAADEAFGKKITVGKEGKAIPGAAEAYAKQLEGGYGTRMGTGGNVGAKEAAGTIKKKEEKRQKLDKKQKEKTDKFLSQLGLPVDTKLDSKEVDDKKEEVLATLERALAKAEADLEVVKKSLPNDTEAHTDAIVNKKKAERELKKFEGAQADIEKIQKELAGLSEEKGGNKKEEKQEEKQ